MNGTKRLSFKIQANGIEQEVGVLGRRRHARDRELRCCLLKSKLFIHYLVTPQPRVTDMEQDDMGHTGVAFTDAGGLEVASFPEVMGVADERLFPNQK